MRNNITLMHAMAINLLRDKTSQKNMAKGIGFLIFAAGCGFSHAQFALAWCYERGIGIEKNPKKAVAYYSWAADQENAGALNNLGVCYERAIGVKQNTGKATECYLRASRLGYNGGDANLRRIKKFGFLPIGDPPLGTLSEDSEDLGQVDNGSDEAVFAGNSHLPVIPEGDTDSPETTDKGGQRQAESVPAESSVARTGCNYQDEFLMLENKYIDSFPLELKDEKVDRVSLLKLLNKERKSDTLKGLTDVVIKKSKETFRSKDASRDSKESWFKGMGALLKLIGAEYEVDCIDNDGGSLRNLCLALAKNNNRRARNAIIELYKVNPGAVSDELDLSCLLNCVNLSAGMINDYIRITEQPPSEGLLNCLIGMFPNRKHSHKTRVLAASVPRSVTAKNKASFLGLLGSKYFMSKKNVSDIDASIEVEAAVPSVPTVAVQDSYSDL